MTINEIIWKKYVHLYGSVVTRTLFIIVWHKGCGCAGWPPIIHNSVLTFDKSVIIYSQLLKIVIFFILFFDKYGC